MAEIRGINIVIDKFAVEAAGIKVDVPVTLNVEKAKLAEVLKRILDPFKLKYVVEKNFLGITTLDKPAEGGGPRANAAAKQPADGSRLRVQVVRSDGVRLTFAPEKFADAALSGTSDVLGACRVPMNQIDQLLIGGAIEQAASQLAYQQWVLHHAIEPKFANGGDSGDGGDAGTESVLVGKPAPLFELDLLAGGKFRLADQKGHVVVLDFWATWCGPCLAAMPQVERAARDFADQGVQLIAVNLEEAPKQIKSMLERHKLDLTVALDRDGAVAEKYKASAIPQTVIIDKEGNVVRVFIGGGPNFDDQVRDALRPLFPDAKPVQ
jgi:peroxiredoxin